MEKIKFRFIGLNNNPILKEIEINPNWSVKKIKEKLKKELNLDNSFNLELILNKNNRD